MARCVPQEAGERGQIPYELRQNQDERDWNGEKVPIHGQICCCRMQQCSRLGHVTDESPTGKLSWHLAPCSPVSWLRRSEAES